jgi:hypothetical protein
MRLESKNTEAPGSLPARPGPLWVTAQITALSFHIPLLILISRQRAALEPESLLFVAISLTGLAIFAHMILTRIIGSGWSALAYVSVSLVIFWHWPEDFGGGWLIGTILWALSLAGVSSVARNRYFAIGSLAVSVTFTGVLTGFLVVETISAPPPVVDGKEAVPLVELADTPDITLIVLDGYGRRDIMRDLYGHDNSGFLGQLENEGFDVADRSTTPYSITHLAIPALLEMALVHEPGDHLSPSDQSAVKQIISGDNNLVRILKGAGYQYIHSEADSRLHSCGHFVDLCLRGPALDITMFLALQRTPLDPLLYPTSGGPNTALALDRIETIRRGSIDSEEIDPTSPVFSFWHLPLPHPPMFLDRDCELRVDEDLSGMTLLRSGDTAELLERRKEAWIDQVECTNGVMLDYLSRVDDDEIILIVSDHGPDSTFAVAGDLDRDQLNERLSNLTAARLPQGCRGRLPEDIQLQNLFRVVLGCLAGRDIALLENRTFAAGFTGPIVEVGP